MVVDWGRNKDTLQVHPGVIYRQLYEADEGLENLKPRLPWDGKTGRLGPLSNSLGAAPGEENARAGTSSQEKEIRVRPEYKS